MSKYIHACILSATLLCSIACAGRPLFKYAHPHVSMVELPLRIRSHLPEVQIQIGPYKHWVMLDLGGGNGLTLHPSILKQTKPSYTGRKRAYRNMKGQTFSAREFTLSTLTLGGLSLRHFRGYEHLYAKNFAPPNKNGTLGHAFLRKFGVLIDYKKKRLRLYPPKQILWKKDAKGVVIPFSLDGYGVISRGSLAGEAVRFLWDTGATHSIIKPTSVRRRLATDSSKSSKQQHSHRWTPTSLKLAGQHIQPLSFQFFSFQLPPVDGYLGANIFARYRVWIDFHRRKILLQ